MLTAPKIIDDKKRLRTNKKTGNELEFFADLDWELKRLNRYGHRFSILLIEVIGEEKEVDHFPEIVKKILRSSDLLYRLTNGNFAAILPCTHETGGECAALRLKRETKTLSNNKLNINVGVISIDIHTNKSAQEIYETVKEDLFKDKR